MKGAVILVVDDDPRVKSSLELAFPEYRFVGAQSGEEGLKLLQKPNQIDLVLLDLKMEGMNGLEALKKIKETNPRLGVVLLTAFGSKDVAVEALRDHADDFIDKPYDIDAMKRKIEGFFEARHDRERDGGVEPGSVDRVIRFLERNYDKRLTLQDVAEEVSLSPKYLSRLFKKGTNKRFTEFRITLRMDQAKKLLKNSSLEVAQIADKLGYKNAESFMKIFKKVLGCTPTEYRMKRISGKAG